MTPIRNLEIHLVHSCNLSCESCSHYSNQGHKGIVSLEEADRWMGLWRQRIAPRVFSLLGGEPTIHPQLPEFIKLARQHWPKAALRIVTNGFFLHRHPTLPLVLQDDPDACLYLSIHHAAAEYQERVKPIWDLLVRWIQQHGIRVVCYHSYKDWTRRYHGFGGQMAPFADGRPRESWEHCPCRYCSQLLEGKIWKCPPLAYLPMQHARHHLSDEWQPYLGYRPLEPDCTEAELLEFLSREEESHCGMCPANPERLEIPIPLATRQADLLPK